MPSAADDPQPWIQARAGGHILLDTNIFVYAAGLPKEEDPQLRELGESAKAIILALGEALWFDPPCGAPGDHLPL